MQDLVRKFPGHHIALKLVLHLIDRLGTRARNGLICRDNDPLDLGVIMQRLKRDHHLDGRTIRVRNDPLVPFHILRVDLRNNERHSLIHAELAGVVNDNRARPGRDRRPDLADIRARRAQDHINALEHIFTEGQQRQAVHLALRAARRNKAQFFDREIALLDDVIHAMPDSRTGS